MEKRVGKLERGRYIDRVMIKSMSVWLVGGILFSDCFCFCLSACVCDVDSAIAVSSMLVTRANVSRSS